MIRKLLVSAAIGGGVAAFSRTEKGQELMGKAHQQVQGLAMLAQAKLLEMANQLDIEVRTFVHPDDAKDHGQEPFDAGEAPARDGGATDQAPQEA